MKGPNMTEINHSFDLTDRTPIAWLDLFDVVPAIVLGQLLLRDQLAPESAEVARQIVKSELEDVVGHITSIQELSKILGLS